MGLGVACVSESWQRILRPSQSCPLWVEQSGKRAPSVGCCPMPPMARPRKPRARDTVERYAERLFREQDFSVAPCTKFLHELQLAWEIEPQCARPDRRKRRNAGVERRRMIFGAFRFGGMTGVTNLTRLWQATARYLNSFLRRRCEEQWTSAESWNALQVSFSTGIAIHRDSQNVKGTYNFLYCSGKYKGGEVWIESASALAADCPRQAEPSVWKDEEHPEGLPGFKVSAKNTVLKFDGRAKHAVLPFEGTRISLAAYTAHTLGEPLPPLGKRLGFSMLAQEEPRLAAWSVFSPATESVLMRSPPHGFGPKVDDIRVRLTFCGVTGQLLERCYTPLEFMEFTEPTDTLTVFLHVDLGKASALAELQLAEVGYDLQGQKRGPNRVMEGHLVDLTRGSSPGDCNPEFHYHLIENEELVDSILNDEVPTESYYQAYRAYLEASYPGARPCVLEHIAELVELFDVCICSGFSLGIDKLVLLKPQVKSLGEIVGRHGRSPDPAKVETHAQWGEIKNLKQLQEFLGTANYSRDQIGPKFAVAMDPLRRYLREGDAGFPLTPRGPEAVERLKKLMKKATCLSVSDEHAAASGSRPYEQLADCCKAGLGGAHLQMSADLKKWLPLAYHAESLTPAQTLWHPFRQEQHAQLRCRRKFRALFGSIPVIMYTDHANIARLQDKPLDQVDPVSFRTCSELTADGSEIRNLSGRSMRLADGLSRLFDTTSLPQDQEKKMLERLEERTRESRELATAHARLKDPDCDDFLEFPEPNPSPKAASKEEVARGEATQRRWPRKSRDLQRTGSYSAQLQCCMPRHIRPSQICRRSAIWLKRVCALLGLSRPLRLAPRRLPMTTTWAIGLTLEPDRCPRRLDDSENRSSLGS